MAIRRLQFSSAIRSKQFSCPKTARPSRQYQDTTSRITSVLSSWHDKQMFDLKTCLAEKNKESKVKAAILESFARENMSESDIDVPPSIKQYIKSNVDFPVDTNAEFIYANCSQSLFNKLVLCCILQSGTIHYASQQTPMGRCKILGSDTSGIRVKSQSYNLEK
ncbi:hypothetical protein WN944_005722 [Citrus x changshan-huyou]|uniref:Uncharacterized protein n=1 Tax=Citrus x changshan-huyou TaxID=2935761 RepID=A0AAP0QWI7_9ROSI